MWTELIIFIAFSVVVFSIIKFAQKESKRISEKPLKKAKDLDLNRIKTY